MKNAPRSAPATSVSRALARSAINRSGDLRASRTQTGWKRAPVTLHGYLWCCAWAAASARISSKAVAERSCGLPLIVGGYKRYARRRSATDEPVQRPIVLIGQPYRQTAKLNWSVSRPDGIVTGRLAHHRGSSFGRNLHQRIHEATF